MISRPIDPLTGVEVPEFADRIYCDDWGCPNWQCCVHAFGRSRAYAAMEIGAQTSSVRRDKRYARAAGADRCRLYEFDKSMCWFELTPGTTVLHKAGTA
jgi:hypothetical protein